MTKKISKPRKVNRPREEKKFFLDGIEKERYDEIHSKVLEVMTETADPKNKMPFQELMEEIKKIPEDGDELERDVAMFALGYYYAATNFIQSCSRTALRR